MKIADGKEKKKFVCVLLVLMFCEGFFLRNILWNDALIGDRGDGRLTNMLTEHWWRFLQGKEGFSELLMFHPVKGALGYSDMFLGHGLLYPVFRITGLNMFVSYKLSLILMHTLGMVSMVYLMRKKLKTGWGWSVFGTLAFCCSDTLARHIGHTQLAAVSMLPVLLILLIGIIQNFEIRRKRNMYTYAFIFLFAVLTYTAWYVAFFCGMYGLVFLIAGLRKVKSENFSLISGIKRFCAVIKYDWIGYVVFLIIVYIPFISIYLPVLWESAGYSYADVSRYLPELIDLVNVTDTNFMLGWLIRLLRLDDRGYSYEVTEGFSCILLFLFFYTFWTHKKRNNSKKARDPDLNIHVPETWNTLIVENVFVTVMICIVFVIRLGSNGVSLWEIVYRLIPTAGSIRAVARFFLWMGFPMAVVTAYCADRYLSLKWKKINVPVVCVSLLFLSNINVNGVSSGWSAHEELAFIGQVAAPPEDADSFYIMDSEKKGDPAVICQLDAFEIANYYDLKTVNGYSGQYPADWDGLGDIYSDAYEISVYEWTNRHGLHHVYAYDRAQNIWTSLEDRMKLGVDAIFYPTEHRFSMSSGLQDSGQGEFAWTDTDFKTVIKNADIQKTGLRIGLKTSYEYYMTQNPDLKPYIQLYVDHTYVRDIPVTDEYCEYTIPMTEHESDHYMIELRSNCYFNPKAIGLNDDGRELSMAIYYIGD